MAVFNPDVKDVQPTNYLGMSQAISPLKNFSTSNGPDVSVDDKSAGTTLAGLGNLFDGAVKAGDSIVKEIIQNELYKKVDEKREGYTSDLEKTGNIPQVQQVADVAGNQPPQPLQSTQNILPDRPEGPLPPELARLPDTLGNLQSASGKLSPTYYTGRLDLIAKDMRTRFPGYRDYIDKQVESITGENPANAYVKQLLTQINQNSENTKSERDKMYSHIYENAPYLGGQAEILAQKVRNGTITMPALIGQIATVRAPLEDMKIAHAKFEAAKDDLEKQKTIASDALPAYANKQFATMWNTATKGIGLSPETMTDRATRFANGEVVPEMGQNPAETLLKYNQVLMSSASTMRQDLIKQSNTPDSSGRTWRQALGEEETNKKIEGALAPWTTTQNLLVGKAVPLAAMNAEMASALTDETTMKLFKNKDLGAVAQTYSAINKYMGPNAGTTLVAQAYGNGLPTDMKKFLDYQKAQIVTPRNGATLKSAVEDAANVGIGASNKDDSNATVPQSHKDFYLELFATNRFIGDKNIPIVNQQEMGKKLYGPGNEGLISKFAKDTIDPVTGQYLEGNIDVFRKLYGPQNVIRGMKELGKADGESWDMFKTSADKAFVNEVFNTEIKDMQSYGESPYIRVKYNSGTQQFSVEKINDPALRGIGSGVDAYYKNASASVARLNKGFSVMTNIIKEDNNPDSNAANAYVLGTMYRLGLDPRKISGLSKDLVNSVINSSPRDPFNTKNGNKNQDRQ